MTECVIFDLDGTLCDSRHRVHYLQKRPKDWAGFFIACSKDPPHPYVLTLYRMIVTQGVPIIICSGRPERYRAQTEEWLSRHKLYYYMLLMRRNDDGREDPVVKKGMLDFLRDKGFKILFAVDDRQTVVDMWRQNGVPVFQVEDTTV